MSILADHEAALSFDFRHYFHQPLSAIGHEISYGEARRLVLELGRETGSHLYADLAEMDRASSLADVADIVLAEWVINALRDKKEHPKPIELPKPWRAKKPNSDVSPAQRAELVERLQRRSVFR